MRIHDMGVFRVSDFVSMAETQGPTLASSCSAAMFDARSQGGRSLEVGLETEVDSRAALGALGPCPGSG
jgi:hypothetical protein